MKFQELLRVSGLCTDFTSSYEVNHICCDSRLAGPFSVFVCIEGAVTDGHLYAGSARSRGCRCFIAQKDLQLPDDCDVCIINDSRNALALLSCFLQGNPSEAIKVIGITGTKGKTTTALMIHGILNQMGIETGYIGSNGIMYKDFHHMTVNTTPESCDIQAHLRDMVDCGVKYAVIEVSSQALYHGRVKYTNFDTLIYTNLYHDHIGGNEHPTFEHYRDCKKSLFTEYKCNRILINSDDPYSEYMVSECELAPETYGIDKSRQNYAENIAMFRDNNTLGMSFDYVCDKGRFPAIIKMPGKYSISNSLAAIAVCRGIVDDIPEIIKALEKISVQGRFEIVPALPYATIIIDYAHNGASMTSVLETLRMYNPNRIITLFGSVGSRTQMRRAELGKIASLLSDYCILTSDNPDTEDPRQIIYEIARSFDPEGCKYYAIPDRKKAIEYAMSILKPGDILLLAGKGHENYQFISGRKIPFCEREIVLETAETMNKINV